MASGAPEVDATARVVPVPSATNLQNCRMVRGRCVDADVRILRVAVMPILVSTVSRPEPRI